MKQNGWLKFKEMSDVTFSQLTSEQLRSINHPDDMTTQDVMEYEIMRKMNAEMAIVDC